MFKILNEYLEMHFLILKKRLDLTINFVGKIGAEANKFNILIFIFPAKPDNIGKFLPAGTRAP